MKNTVLPSRADEERCPAAFSACLPIRLSAELRQYAGEWEELRLRCGTRSDLLSRGHMFPLETVLTQPEMDGVLNALCGGSMYAHQNTLRQGYVILRGGIRVGVCGRLRTDGGRILGIDGISSLVFRFPRFIPVPVGDICRRLLSVHPGRGVLIYSPPGVGKTTLLRALIRVLTQAPYRMRLSVIDTREELAACGTAAAGAADWLSGYPRAMGIEIATRTLNPQLIVCDEIGDTSEAMAICAACNAGVPLVATAHGSSAAALLRRQGLRLLHDHGVFGSYVGLSRANGVLSQQVTLADEVCG